MAAAASGVTHLIKENHQKTSINVSTHLCLVAKLNDEMHHSCPLKQSVPFLAVVDPEIWNRRVGSGEGLCPLPRKVFKILYKTMQNFHLFQDASSQ